MIVITIIKALFTNTPQYLEIKKEEDDFNLFHMSMTIEAAENHAQFEDSIIMQSSQFILQGDLARKIHTYSGFLSARQTCILSK